LPTRFSDAYSEVKAGLASPDFSTEREWQKLLDRARKLVGDEGFEVSHSGLVDELRKKVERANGRGGSEAALLFQAAGRAANGIGAAVDVALARRLGALKMLRHTYFLKRFGGHKVWIVAIPGSFTDWPHNTLKGDEGHVTTRLNDRTERFSLEDRKNLSHASQEALKWVHRGMMVAGSPRPAKNRALLTRWFAGGRCGDAEIARIASTINEGLKKISATLKSGLLIYTDSVSERATSANAGAEAFVWQDRLDVVYVEDEFFGAENTVRGLTNWARILIHELTHAKLGTKDHAYEWQGMSPEKIGSAKAVENADSWAWFCADCAGALTDGLVEYALGR
jgi:hypothetical protein